MQQKSKTKPAHRRVTSAMGRKGIQFVTERVILRGEKYRLLKHFRAKDASALPSRYINTPGGVCLFTEQKGARLTVQSPRGCHTFMVGQTISEAKYQELLKLAEEAGTRLREINETLTRENADWHGHEAVTI